MRSGGNNFNYFPESLISIFNQKSGWQEPPLMLGPSNEWYIHNSNRSVSINWNCAVN